MPVIATPSPVAPQQCVPCAAGAVPVTLSAVPCDGQQILSAPITTLHRQPLLARMRSVVIRGGSQPTIEWQMHDADGNPVNLSDCVCPPASSSSNSSSSASDSSSSSSAANCPATIKLRLREQLSLGRCVAEARYTYDGTITNAAEGLVQVDLPRRQTLLPGVYFAEMAAVATNDAGEEYVLFSNIFYVVVEQGLWAKRPRNLTALGPPTIAEVRLHLRDSSPEESFLLDNVMFDDAEIAQAIILPVQYWNEIPPPLGKHATTHNFPFRYHWLIGITGHLFLIAAEHFRRNTLQYDAGGVRIDDMNKEQPYEAAAQRRLEEYRAFVRAKKAEINLAAAWGEVGSSYQYQGVFYGRRF